MTNTKSPTKSTHRVPPYRRPIIVVVFLLIIVAIAAITVFIISSLQPAKDSTTVPDQEDTIRDPDQPVIIDPTDTDTDSNKPPQFEGEDPNDSQELTGSISVKDISAGTLYIAATIDQYLENSGTCTLIISNSTGEEYKFNGEAVADITTSVCSAFEVPLNDLSEGHWNLKIELSGNGKTGIITDNDGIDI